MEVLEATIRRWASSGCDPFPCGLEVWRYACELSGVPVRPLPDHSSRRAMVDLLHLHGGLEAYARSLMLSLGWEEVADPRRGDVAVVDFPAMGLTCAICLGRTYMAKGAHTVLTLPAPHRAAWRIGCRKPLPPQSSQP